MIRKVINLVSAAVVMSGVMLPSVAASAAAQTSTLSTDRPAAYSQPPQPTAQDRALPGKPGIKNKPGVKPPTPCSSPCIMYAGASAGGVGSGLSVIGATDNMGIYAPTLKQTVTADYHTLGELAAQSTDGQQTIEVGYNIDKSVNGDLKTRLFVFAWRNSVGLGYNGGGYVDYAPETTYYAGMDLTSYLNTQHYMYIQYSGGAWWIGFDPSNGTGIHWIGYYPGSIWTSPTYTSAGLVQVFGEVAAAQKPTCTDMGNGTVPGASGGAQMGSFSTLTGTTWALTALTHTYSDATNGYTYYPLSSYSFRYGGGGSPQAVGC